MLTADAPAYVPSDDAEAELDRLLAAQGALPAETPDESAADPSRSTAPGAPAAAAKPAPHRPVAAIMAALAASYEDALADARDVPLAKAIGAAPAAPCAARTTAPADPGRTVFEVQPRGSHFAVVGVRGSARRTLRDDLVDRGRAEDVRVSAQACTDAGLVYDKARRWFVPRPAGART